MSEKKKAVGKIKAVKKVVKKVKKAKVPSEAVKPKTADEVVLLDTEEVTVEKGEVKKEKWKPNIAPIPKKFTERRGKTGKILKPLTVKKIKVMDVDSRGVINEVSFKDNEEHLKNLAVLAGYRIGEPNSSIFGLADFPPIGNVNWSFTPKCVLKAILMYSSTTKDLMLCLEENGVDYFRYITLVRKNYPIVVQMEGVCAQTRAHLFNSRANKVFEDGITEDAYEQTSFGRKVMPAWTQFMIAKAKHFEGQAKYNERRSYNKNTEATIADVNIEVSVGAKFSLEDMMKRSPSEMGDLL